MQRFGYVLIVAILLPASSRAQLWDTLAGGFTWPAPPKAIYADSVTNLLYAGGRMIDKSGTVYDKVRTWDGTKWDTLASSATDPGEVWCFARYGNHLYVGGTFQELDGINTPYIARWDGNQWDSLPTVNTPDGSVLCMLVWNNELYVGGSFDSIGGMYSAGVARWNGASWFEVGGGLENGLNSPRVNDLSVYNGKVYAGGTFRDTLDNVLCLAVLEGGSWARPPNWQIGIPSFVFDLEVYQGELYVGGQFIKSDGVSLGENIVKFDGSEWSEVVNGLGAGLGLGVGTVRGMEVFNNELWVVGNTMFTAGGAPVNSLAIWNGSQWCGTGAVFDNIITVIEVWKDSVYIAGNFQTIDGDSVDYIARWAGGAFRDSCGWFIGEDELSDVVDIVIYPNPAGETVTVEVSGFNGPATLSVFDTMGQNVMTQQLTQQQTTIATQSLDAGVYLYRVTDAEGRVQVGRFVRL